MELFIYRGYIYGEHVAGFVKANNLQEAMEILKKIHMTILLCGKTKM